MKMAAVLLLALALAAPEMRYFRYERPISLAEQKSGQACLELDTEVFAHAAPGLADLRLYRARAEVPYLIHQATAPEPTTATILPLNAGERGGQSVFDVEMAAGRYSDLELELEAQNFVATVTVAGSQTQSGAQTRIGAYTIFDLTRQRLGRGTVLHLPESDYRYLHFRIAGTVQAESITGVKLLRDAVEKPRYRMVAELGQGAIKDHATVFTAIVPAHVPVDRLVIAPAAQPALFNRTVRVTTTPLQATPEHPAREEYLTEGNLLRVHGVQQGRRIDAERLAIETPQGDSGEEARWTITIDNGDDAPLQMEAARLEMVERELCFDSSAGAATTLYYGDAALAAPRYDYGALTTAQTDAMPAALGAETANPSYQARPDQRPLTERHPWLLWAALCGVIAVLGVVAWRTVKPASI
jgi:hypothetical protein